jgi:anti-sigma factor RsiW
MSDRGKNIRIRKSMFIEDLDIQAYVDNELYWKDRKFLEQLMKFDPKVEKRVQELENQKRLVQLYWQHENETLIAQ